MLHVKLHRNLRHSFEIQINNADDVRAPSDKKAVNRSIAENNTYWKISSLFITLMPVFNACNNSQFHFNVIAIFFKNNLSPYKFTSHKSNYLFYSCAAQLWQTKHWREQSTDLYVYKFVASHLGNHCDSRVSCKPETQSRHSNPPFPSLNVPYIDTSAYPLCQLPKQGHISRKCCSKYLTQWTRSSTNDQWILLI